MIRRPPRPTLVPNTTLFRSVEHTLLWKDLHLRVFKSHSVAMIVAGEQSRLGEELAGAGRVQGDQTTVVGPPLDRKSTRLNSSHANIPYAVLRLKKKYNYPSA